MDCTVEALDEAGFRYRHGRLPVGSTTLARFEFALARVRFGSRPRPVAIVPLKKGCVIRVGRTEAMLGATAGAGPAFVPAGHPCELEFGPAECAFALCEFDPEQFIRSNANVLSRLDSAFVRESLLRSSPFVVDGDARDTTALCVLTQVIRTIGAFAPAGAPAVFPELEDCLLKALYVVLFAGRAPQEAAALPDQPTDVRLRRLCAKILDNLSSELTLQALARECGLSVRTIQYLFQRQFGTTPKQWIIEQRLLAVRARLSHPGESDSVTSVAIRFFNNLGDFARRYRRRFGEKPSETLARSRHQR